jgi:hypothetical protein
MPESEKSSEDKELKNGESCKEISRLAVIKLKHFRLESK